MWDFVYIFQWSLINSFNRYFDGIILPVPSVISPLQLLFLKKIHLAALQYTIKAFIVSTYQINLCSYIKEKSWY